MKYINSNCFDTMKQFKDGELKCIVTDPPYGIDFHGKYDPDTKWDKIDDYETFIRQFLTEVKRVLSDDGVLWMCMGVTQLPTVFKVIKEVGLVNQYDKWKILSRAKGRGSKKKLKSVREEVLCITKTPKCKFNESEWVDRGVNPFCGEGKPRGWALDVATGTRVRWDGIGNIMHFSTPYYLGVGEKMIHSCQKPLLMWIYLIMCSTDKGDTVFDPFAGSFSSGVAAKLCDRDYIGCELDSDMYDKAMKWIDSIDNPTEKVKAVLKEYIN